MCRNVSIVLDDGTAFVSPHRFLTVYRKKGFLDVIGYFDLWQLCN